MKNILIGGVVIAGFCRCLMRQLMSKPEKVVAQRPGQRWSDDFAFSRVFFSRKSKFWIARAAAESVIDSLAILCDFRGI
jgi:hypothetical protein